MCLGDHYYYKPHFTDGERKAEWQSWDYQPGRSVFRVRTVKGARVLITIYIDIFIYLVTVSLTNPQGLWEQRPCLKGSELSFKSVSGT